MPFKNFYSLAQTLLGIIASKRHTRQKNHHWDGSANAAVRLGVDNAGSRALDWSSNLRL